VTVAITGASGMIGQRLTQCLRDAGHTPVAIPRGSAPPECDALVNLAGEQIAQRWTAAAKKRIYDSRVEGPRRLVTALAARSQRPQVLVSASGIGVFGERGDEILTESSAPGSGFMAKLALDWEAAARLAEPLGIRVVCLRFSMVLGQGGALAKLLPLFRLGVGGRLSSGRQWMSWVHIDDVVSLILFVIENTALHGSLNATSPKPVTNSEFTRRLAAAVRRPAIFPVPALALSLVFGEMSKVLLESQRAIPAAAQAADFKFQYPDLSDAFADLLTGRR
jgi:uncharacterized protein (TIGR01777 family)